MIEPNRARPAPDVTTDGAREVAAPVVRIRGGTVASSDDWLAVERPLQIIARVGGELRPVSTTMRTPGEDRALVAGFLYAERVIQRAEQLRALESIDPDSVLVELDDAGNSALSGTQRPFVTTGACGVCGRGSLDALLDVPTVADGRPRVSLATVRSLPEALRATQATFAHTGGLHAAGLFTAAGEPVAAYEDVGRHNALDKLVGARLLLGRLGDPDGVLVVSGRASFELVQKAAVAGFAVMIAVGAPSSLAVDLAGRAGITLIGFARAEGCNIYCGAERIDHG